MCLYRARTKGILGQVEDDDGDNDDDDDDFDAAILYYRIPV